MRELDLDIREGEGYPVSVCQFLWYRPIGGKGTHSGVTSMGTFGIIFSMSPFSMKKEKTTNCCCYNVPFSLAVPVYLSSIPIGKVSVIYFQMEKWAP
jgi:hypothetical protein